MWLDGFSSIEAKLQLGRGGFRDFRIGISDLSSVNTSEVRLKNHEVQIQRLELQHALL